MTSNKYMEDLVKLEKIAHEQNNKLNISLILFTIKLDGEELQNIIEYFNSRGIEIIYSDIEPDDIEDDKDVEYIEVDSSIKPFDPSKIDIKMDKMTIDSIVKRIRNKEFEFDSDFQRKAGLWTNKQKSQLIESMLLKIPLPAFYFDASNDDKWLIIDGLQRVTTIRDFVVNQSLKLSGMEFLIELNGFKFDDLPRSLQRRIEETNVNTYLVNPATPQNVKFNIFKRINTGGLTLEPQEIRNALYQGQATNFIHELSDLAEFTKATNNSIKNDRMLDREFCLRYVAFTCLQMKNYNGVVDDFLNDAMIFLNNSDDNMRRDIKKKFIVVMKTCYDIFGIYAFRKMGSDGRRRPINKAIFEAWSYVIYNLLPEQTNYLKAKKSVLHKKFISLCEDYYFLNALKASDKKSLQFRIQCIEDMVKLILKEGNLE